ncbi:hypothetical protein [Streptomyces sp. NRRL F-5123]|uniref:hypothetical protein n=1 Tax=Streptomyces sp. NRRL F-5123 TaxID=1463856 RepID=UPI0004E1E16E|nr:hypothetical protein [Streptomyces sp. NRRL F-5123]
METLQSDSIEVTAGRQAAADLQDLLAALDTDPDLLRRITRWTNWSESEEYVYVPPLPVAVVRRLVQLLPEAVS